MKEVAEELLLEWHTVKELEKYYWREYLRRVGVPCQKIFGVDEIYSRKRHT